MTQETLTSELIEAATKDGQLVRKLRWQIKQMSRQLGRQGDTIHRLRCELAEVRELNGRVERGELRGYERDVARMDRIIRSLEADVVALHADNGELRARLRELVATDRAGESTP